MIAWMVSALLTTAMLAGAAIALEEAARLLGRPIRWGWVAAMGTAGALPLFSRLFPAEAAAAPAAGTIDPDALRALLATTQVIERPAGLMERLMADGVADPWLTAFWAAAAAVMGGGLLITHRRLQRVRSAAVPARIADIPVLLTRAIGPMVVGLRRPQIVMPRWIDELPEKEQRMVLRHEWEHASAGDTRLLLFGAVLVAAMPWNVPLWWMRSRLRQAIEVDCDARVLAAGADRRVYGNMLIRTAGRPRPAPLIAPALVELPSLLERRIIAMTEPTPAHRKLRLGTAAVLTALLFAAACELTPRSTALSPTEPTLAEVLGAEGEEELVLEETAEEQDLVPVTVLVPAGREDGTWVTAPGDTIRIRMRASELTTGSANPVVLVDGVRVESLDQLDPSRIQSIDVLKGQSALDAYGPEAVDGLIKVTTGTPQSRPRSAAPAASPQIEEARSMTYARTARAIAPSPRVEEVRAMDYVEVVPGEAPVAVSPAAVTYSAAPVVEPATAVRYSVAEVAERVSAVATTVAPAAEAVSAATAAVAPAASTLRIRGAGTPAAATEPLILVDGDEVASLSELTERFPSDAIASITVLKDESATALYGPRGRNGVILVTLKK